MAKKKKNKNGDMDGLGSVGADGTVTMEKEENPIVSIALYFLILLIWLAIFAAFIKFDVGGFGSKVLTPVLKDVPVVNMILPTAALKEATENDNQYPYSSMDEAMERIKALELQLDEANTKNTDLTATNAELQSEIDRLSVFETNQTEFEKTKEEFYNEIVYAENAPDIGEYTAWYESIDSENAALIYSQVIGEVEHNEEVKEFAKTYSAMKAKQAAAIFDTMTDNLNLVAEILENMSAQARADILGAMDQEVAASVTKILAPEE